MKITVLRNQSFMDLALQHTGDVLNAFDIAAANNMAVSDTPVSGTVVTIPETIAVNDDVLNYYAANGIRPATGVQDETVFAEHKGIGTMRIGGTLKID